jgi:hypothetical protein
MTTHYDTLGVAPDAADDEVRRAWIAMARRHHPDRGGDPASMRAVIEAWAVLSDPTDRRRYDSVLGVGRRVLASDFDEDEPVVDDDVELQSVIPVRVTRGTPALALLPPSLFVMSIFVACTGLVLDEPTVLGVAAVVFLFSCVSVAAVALLSLRGAPSVRRGRR